MSTNAKAVLVASLVFSMVLCLPLFAKAGEGTVDFLQMTCIPELDYFSVQPIVLSRELPREIHIDDDALAQMLMRLKVENQLYTPEALLKTLYECKLPHRTVTIKVEDYVAPHQRGECSLVENFEISLWIGNQKKYQASPFGINRCSEAELHTISLNGFDRLKDCSIEEFGSKKSCKSTILSHEK